MLVHFKSHTLRLSTYYNNVDKCGIFVILSCDGKACEHQYYILSLGLERFFGPPNHKDDFYNELFLSGHHI